MRLLIDFPDSASVRLRVLNAYLQAGDREAALQEAVELAKRGYVFSPAAREQFLSFEPTDEQITRLGFQVRNSVPIEVSSLLATIPAEARLVESVWQDPRTGDLFATTVVSRALFVGRQGGEWARLPIEGAGSLSGMAYDERTGLLWLASGVFEPTPDSATAFRGLIAIDPANGEVRRRVAASVEATPGDLAIGSGGEVYASDPLSGAIYVARPGAATLETLVAPGTFRSPQGIATFPDGADIVVSDYRYGLALVDTAVGAIQRISAGGLFTLDGIDGLWRRGDKLIAIQNGARPMRIVELTFGTDHAHIAEERVLERAHSAWTEPVSGSIVGENLIYVATGQWEAFAEGGALAEGASAQPTEVRLLPLLETTQQPR